MRHLLFAHTSQKFGSQALEASQNGYACALRRGISTSADHAWHCVAAIAKRATHATAFHASPSTAESRVHRSGRIALRSERPEASPCNCRRSQSSAGFFKPSGRRRRPRQRLEQVTGARRWSCVLEKLQPNWPGGGVHKSLTRRCQVATSIQDSSLRAPNHSLKWVIFKPPFRTGRSKYAC